MMKQHLCLLLTIALTSRISVGDPQSFEHAKQVLDESVAESGPHGFQDFVDLVNNEAIELSEEEYSRLRIHLATLQQPEISRSELLDLIATKQEMIVDYVAHVESHGINAPDYADRQYEIIASGNKAFVRESRAAGDDALKTFSCTAYDGQVIRNFNGQTNQGVIELLEPRHLLELVSPHDNPIVTSMLLNSEIRMGMIHDDTDLAAMLKNGKAIIFTAREEINGHACLVVSVVSSTVYLDPELDFGVIRREGWFYNPSDGGKMIRRDWLSNNRDFEATQSGLLFPRTVEFVNTSDGRGRLVTTTHLAINEGVDESVFQEGIIPDGIETFDMTKGGASYIFGDTRSMEQALRIDTPVKPVDRRQNFWGLLYLNLAILVGIGAFLAYRKRSHKT